MCWEWLSVNAIPNPNSQKHLFWECLSVNAIPNPNSQETYVLGMVVSDNNIIMSRFLVPFSYTCSKTLYIIITPDYRTYSSTSESRF